jgi:flagellar assembly factor FliW
MRCTSSRFGQFEIDEKSLLTFPSGILGFPDWTRYVILDHDTDAPFKWLHSVEQAELAFVIIDPVLFKPDYRVHIGADALAEIESDDARDLSIAVILTIPSDDPGRITGNLRGPLVMNPRTRRCKQLVLSEDYPTRYPLFAPEPSVSPVLQRAAS